jgi:hypothetical protein
MRRPYAIAIAGVIAAALLAGCGGHTATRQDVVARANAICFTAQQAARSIAPPSATNPRALAAYFEKLTPIVAQEARELAALPRPPQRQQALNRYVEAIGASVAEYRTAARAAAAGDTGGATQALAQLQAGGAVGYAHAYGLTQCTGSAAPPA